MLELVPVKLILVKNIIFSKSLSTFAVKMKKFLAFLTLVLYGLSSTGATLHLYYCCGKLDKVSFSTVQQKCHKAFMKGKECCNNKQVDLKLKADQEPVAKVLSHVKLVTAVHIPVMATWPLPAVVPNLIPYATGPPALNRCAISLFLYNCVFRI